ncbi:MAG: lipopolysaccharide core biosynthesis protein [Syntrophorhabdaceae bacterium PtaU1.Bin034]|nr:MAG: lipopolysaccharide core biosynthesis protein [Syntrophorhabdaceae bacterium PtaU1.Bin034]
MNRSSADRLLSANGLDESKPYLLLAPWASAQARTYPAERFAVAARDLSRHAGLRVVVTGSTKDVAGSGEMLNVLDGRAVNLVGMTTVGELAALVKSAKLVLTCNSSAMHLADAFRVPAIVLYSGTDCESQWRPRVAPCALLRRATPCSPCYAFTCPNHLECLDIPPDEVLEAGIKLLEGTFGKTEDERLGS